MPFARAESSATNCGTGGSQSYGYDPFGNIAKTGGGGFGTFSPTYQTSSNRYASIPGVTVHYDSNGNVLSDGFHTYTWDADGDPLTIDGVGLTYDAFDRMVEQNRSGSYNQIVIRPLARSWRSGLRVCTCKP